MFSPKMLMLSGMPALRNFDAIKASNGSRASGKAAHREEKSWCPGSLPSWRTKSPRLIRSLLG